MSKSMIAIEVIFGVFAWTACVLSLCPAGYGQTPKAHSEEVREFEILVSGKLVGTSTTRITEAENGMTTACTDAFVKLNYIVYSYQYEFRGQEVWEENRLISVENHAVDDGVQLATHARSDLRGSVIEAQGKKSIAGPVLSMTTSYWRVPVGQKGCMLKLLDADQGIVHTVRIDDITVERLAIGGKQADCTHYHLSGDLVANLWFDAQQRLVQQKTIEDGRPVELRLTRISTKAAPSIRP
jgi:hypothetical protein